MFGAPLLGALYAHTGRFTEAFALTAALPLAALVACRRLPGAAGRQGSGGASRSGDPAGAREDAGGGVFVRETQTDFTQGMMQRTENATDLAIEGEGFFQVAGEDGPLLTRAGDFTLDATGRLVTQGGRTVLSEAGGPVVLDSRFPIDVSRAGVVRQNDLEVPLAVVRPNSPADLVKVGENLFRPLDRVQPVPPAERQVRQNMLERSTVRPMVEMVQLIETSRAYETNIRMIQHQDEMTGQLLGRVFRS